MKLILEVVDIVVVVVVLMVVVVVLRVVVLGVVLTLMGFWKSKEFSGQAGLARSCLFVCKVWKYQDVGGLSAESQLIRNC